MQKLTQAELDLVISDHYKWLQGNPKGIQANLSRKDLSGLSLSDRTLSNVDLSNTNLSNADLSDANLSNVNLGYADLSNAILYNTDLSSANLYSVNLSEINQNFQLPQNEDLIVFKKVRNFKDRYSRSVLKLLIPAAAKRTASLAGNKCRAEFAMVLEAFDLNENPISDTDFRSMYDCNFLYKIGQEVRPDSFDDDIRYECKPGIHFFKTFAEARNY